MNSEKQSDNQSSIGQILLEKDAGGLDRLRLVNKGASVVVYLQGAHVTEYSPAGLDNLLWVSDTSYFQEGKSIRGGIPICWPWFGEHPDASKPQHGFARQSIFEAIASVSDGEMISVVLRLLHNFPPIEEWRGKADIEVEIRLADSLWMEMRTTNLAEESIAISNCFHNYFAVRNARKVQIPKLQNISYLDKTLGFEQHMQSQPFVVDKEVDRIYLENGGTTEIIDSEANRQIDIQTWGLENVVVWNPWEEKAKQMQDFDDAGYLNMICVEPANAMPESVTLQPGETIKSGQELRLIS